MAAEVDSDDTMFVDGARTRHHILSNTKMSLFQHAPTSGPHYRNPVILIHGEHYTAKIWGEKPDGGNGWASDFVKAGFMVFTPTMPLNGTPNDQTLALIKSGATARRMPPGVVEMLMTAPAIVQRAHWPSRHFHTQWPGTGKRGDPIFEKLMNATVPVYLDRQEREAMGQQGLVELLGRLGQPAILIGHGSGANMAWLAADMVPSRVAAIIAFEPLGPPFGNARKRTATGNLEYKDDFSDLEIKSDFDFFDFPSIKELPRKYGVAEIPLTFDPPPRAPTYPELLDERFQPIPYRLVPGPAPGSQCFLQETEESPPRQLANLKGIHQAVWTAPASFHTTFDWATVAFLKQAGVDCAHLVPKPELGNGHLCFLEKNSGQISRSIIKWINSKLMKVENEPANQQQPTASSKGRDLSENKGSGKNEASHENQTPAQDPPVSSDHSQAASKGQVSDHTNSLNHGANVFSQETQINSTDTPRLLAIQDSVMVSVEQDEAANEASFSIMTGLAQNMDGQPSVARNASTVSRTSRPTVTPVVHRQQKSLTPNGMNKSSKEVKPRRIRGPYKKTLEKRALAAALAEANAASNAFTSNPTERLQVNVGGNNSPSVPGQPSNSPGLAITPPFYSVASFEPVRADRFQGVPTSTVVDGASAPDIPSLTHDSGPMNTLPDGHSS